MEALYLNCHGCEHSFPSGTCVVKQGARGLSIEGHVYQCPYCHTRETYLTEELHRADAEAAPAPRSSLSEWRLELASVGTCLTGSRLWVGVAIGASVTIAAIGLVPTLHAGLLSVGF